MSDKISFAHQYSTIFNRMDVTIQANKDTTHIKGSQEEKTGETIAKFTGFVSITNTALWQLNIDNIITEPRSQGLYAGEKREESLNLIGKITPIEKSALENIRFFYDNETDPQKKATLKEIYNLTLQNAKYGLFKDAVVPDSLKTITGK